MKKISAEELKKNLKSDIVQNFKKYVCPTDYIYSSCIHVKKIYEDLFRKINKDKIHYSLVSKEIEKKVPCGDVIVCPLLVPNSFERVLNLNKDLKSLELGELRIKTSDIIEIV